MHQALFDCKNNLKAVMQSEDMGAKKTLERSVSA